MMDFNPPPQHPPVNTWDWFLTLLIIKIPLIGFIMLIVWAVDKDGNPNKANWAKAKLIWYAIGFVIAVLILGIIGLGALSGFFDQMDWSDL